MTNVIEQTFVVLRRAAEEVGVSLQALEASGVENLSGPQAAEMLDVFARLRNLAAAGVTLAAGRISAVGGAAAGGGVGQRARDVVADKLGMAVSSAERLIDTATKLDDLGSTRALFLEGVLSEAEVAEVVSGASRNRAAEDDLLAAARHESFRRLRDKAAATVSPDPDADRKRAAAARAGRGIKTWSSAAEGFGYLKAFGPTDVMARFAAHLNAEGEERFRAARASGNHEASGAYRFDALMALAGLAVSDDGMGTVRVQGGGPGTEANSSGSVNAARPGGPGPRDTLLMRIDIDAWLRGYTEPGEVCDIAGLGTVPVSVIRDRLGDSVVKVLISKGVDLKTVVHPGRTFPSHLLTALAWAETRCANPGCDRRLGLQRDHVWPVGKGGQTSFDNLQFLCGGCHAEKTRKDYPNGTSWSRPEDRSGVRRPARGKDRVGVRDRVTGGRQRGRDAGRSNPKASGGSAPRRM